MYHLHSFNDALLGGVNVARDAGALSPRLIANLIRIGR
jgi:hypothetical protein